MAAITGSRPGALGLAAADRHARAAVRGRRPGQDRSGAANSRLPLPTISRGLHLICALSDQWGYTTPSQTGKVVWALFYPRQTPPTPARYPSRPGRDRFRKLTQPASVNDPPPGRQWQEHRVLACGPHPQVTCG
jgi:hypothetical protein